MKTLFHLGTLLLGFAFSVGCLEPAPTPQAETSSDAPDQEQEMTTTETESTAVVAGDAAVETTEAATATVESNDPTTP
ncbi:MAG: hypothetical protein H6822_15760 [Planctomycetaceae bacterium]|nr:hypothetical protein [Planctomycetales bacterium]MCB9923636.1 hypothetical protein [Planctomycetaceae bacterium]